MVQPSDTVEDVKSIIQDKEGIPFHNHFLFLGSNQLEDGHTISTDYDAMMLNLLLRVKGKSN